MATKAAAPKASSKAAPKDEEIIAATAKSADKTVSKPPSKSGKDSDKAGDKGHINVTSYTRLALLPGEVPNDVSKDDAEAAVRLVPNVKAISNELVMGEPSALSARSNDSYITSKVKARFLDYKRFNANHVKVVTEAGVVFLMGLVTLDESNAAVEIARTTGGVKKVIRLFEIITPEAAMAADGKKPAAATPAK